MLDTNYLERKVKPFVTCLLPAHHITGIWIGCHGKSIEKFVVFIPISFVVRFLWGKETQLFVTFDLHSANSFTGSTVSGQPRALGMGAG